MKKILLFLSIPFISFGQTGFTGKPQYSIKVKRMTADTGNVVMKDLGVIMIELYPAIAPKAVANFDSLAKNGLYDSTAFHRVIPGFVVQGGDPNSINQTRDTWGYGQVGQKTVPAEFSVLKHLRGTLAAARSTNINSATSQFYICVAPQPSLDGKYTIYGHVISGMDVVDTIVKSQRDTKDNPFRKIDMFVTRTGSNDSVPAVPSLVLPANKAVAVEDTQEFQWTKVPAALMYTAIFCEDSLFQGFIIKKNSIVNSAVVTGLKSFTKYYWKVQSNNGGNVSPFSSVFVFNTGVYMGVNDLLNDTKGTLSQNIPNPATGQTKISFTLSKNTPVTLKVFDITGKLISEPLNKLGMIGSHTVELDLRNYKPGVYIYQLNTDSGSINKKMIVLGDR